jgi:ABC-2 type transport system ATP-binding protein
VTTHEVREIEHLLTDVVFIDHGRSVLALSMENIEDEFAKVVVAPSERDAARALDPLSERPSLQGIEYVYRGAPPDALHRLGPVSRPNLAELFVAVMGGAA